MLWILGLTGAADREHSSLQRGPPSIPAPEHAHVQLHPRCIVRLTDLSGHTGQHPSCLWPFLSGRIPRLSCSAVIVQLSNALLARASTCCSPTCLNFHCRNAPMMILLIKVYINFKLQPGLCFALHLSGQIGATQTFSNVNTIVSLIIYYLQIGITSYSNLDVWIWHFYT